MGSVVLVLFLLAQQSISSATLSGHVTDATGAAVAGVPVSVTSIARNQTFNVTTDAQGRYQFLSLPVGDYRVSISKSGFAPYERTVTLSIGQSAQLPIELTLGAIASTVDVITQAQVAETARTQVAETILPAEIDNLPLNGRNYLDLALLAPGVSKTNTGNNDRFAETSAVPGTGISVAGQRNLGNSFVVDGLSANDDAAELAGTFFSPEVIREFQVVTSGAIAEFGRSYSGVVNVVTQSGANDWHGRVYGFLRNHRLDARNAFAASRNPLTQAQYGATFSLPLKRDRAFLFANFEREDLNRSGLITIAPANVSVINTTLAQVGYPSRVETGAYPTGDNRSNFFAKSDVRLGKTALSLRYNIYDLFSPNARNVGALSAVSRGTVVDTLDQTIAANAVTSLSGSALNELRVQFTRSRFGALGNDLIGPAVGISGVANFGASTSSPTGRDIDSYEVADSYSVLRGAHFLKVGANVIYDRVNILFPATLYGTYSFSSLAAFQAGTYTSFGQAFGKTDWRQANPNIGWFVQDEWKLRHAVTLNVGLRHDVQWLDAGVHTRAANFAPRVGLAWAPGKGKTVIRTGFGIYYDRVPLRAIANAQRGAGTDYKAISLQRTQTGAPVFPNKLATLPVGVLFNLSTIDPDIKNASAIQSNLEVERELSRGLSVSAGYLYVRGNHVIMNRNLNVPTLTATQDPVNLGRPNPNYQNITQYSGQGDSYYNGMTLSLDYKRSKWASARVSYTLSKSLDDTGNAFFSSPQDNFNIRNDRGLSDNDQRHRLTASGSVRFAGGFQFSPIFTYSTAYPFNVVTGGQTLQTTAARPTGVGRNTGKGFNYASLDMRLSRRIAVTDRINAEALAESFNVLNRTNLQFPNNTFGTGTAPLATFGRATNAADPRQMQLGLRLSF
jgi:hypothetical protein